MMQEGISAGSLVGDRVKIMWALELQSLNRPLFFSEIRSVNYRVWSVVPYSEYTTNDVPRRYSYPHPPQEPPCQDRERGPDRPTLTG